MKVDFAFHAILEPDPEPVIGQSLRGDYPIMHSWAMI
jgi:hypothetical protein